MAQIIDHKNYKKYPRDFKKNFKKIFKISFISSDGIIITSDDDINLEYLKLFDTFYEVFIQLRSRRSNNLDLNWNDFCQFIYDLNTNFYYFIEDKKCGICINR